ncbi:hypothetical protein ACWD6P_04265 [Streptomyces sp. NPDC002446]
MTDRRDDTPDPRHHPELLAWLAERSAGFEQWARSTGCPERWDFGPASLDALEELLRRTFRSDQDIEERRRGALLQGAVWYLGEVACRSTGVVWTYEPLACADEPLPPLFGEVHAPGTVDTPCVRPTGDRTDDRLYVMAPIFRLFMAHDEVGNPIDERLRGVVYDCGRFQRLAEWLQARATGFEEWARATGQAESWDFGPASLDALEELVRGRYSGEEELQEERDGLFVQGAVWYVGEVIRRSTPETSWGYDPFAMDAGDTSGRMFTPGADDELDTPYLTQPHFQEEDFVYPLSHLLLLFWKGSARYRREEAHLRDLLDEFE